MPLRTIVYISDINYDLSMSSRKEQRTGGELTATTTSTSQFQQEQQQSINRALDETKNNIRKATEEVRKGIPRYTQAVNDYQEQTIQAVREMSDNYLESQKEIINSIQSVWAPQIQKISDMLYVYCISPRKVSENYTKVVSSFTDNTVAAISIVNNAIFATLQAFKTSVQNTRDNVMEFSRIGVNAAKIFEQTSRDTANSFSR